MTTNIELNKKLGSVEEYIGTFPRDKLPEITSYPTALIVNTDFSAGVGEHWIAIYINDNRFGEYFDSYGMSPLIQEVSEFLNEYCTEGWTSNQSMIQGFTSMKCGQFCVLFVFLKSLGVSLFNIIKLFTKSHDVNDIIVEKLYREL